MIDHLYHVCDVTTSRVLASYEGRAAAQDHADRSRDWMVVHEDHLRMLGMLGRAPLRILLVEDDVLLGPMLHRQFRRRGHEVVLRSSILAARAELHRAEVPFDVIVTDRDVEDGDAWAAFSPDVAGVLRSDARVVHMTARQAMPGDPDRVFRKGQDPIRELIARVEER